MLVAWRLNRLVRKLDAWRLKLGACGLKLEACGPDQVHALTHRRENFC